MFGKDLTSFAQTQLGCSSFAFKTNLETFKRKYRISTRNYNELINQMHTSLLLQLGLLTKKKNVSSAHKNLNCKDFRNENLMK